MRFEKGQMLLLTGITMILIALTAAFISVDLSNIDVQTSVEESHPLFLEYKMVKEKFLQLFEINKENLNDQEAFDKTLDTLESIEIKYNINLYANLDIINTPPTIYLCLESKEAKICETIDI